MISVIIPSYNRATLIERSARSVLEQTYRDLELIIVDDCSTDETRNVVMALGDERVRYICHERNLGACAARNTGIDAARGEYIAFQDSDDVWRPEKLKKQIAALDQAGVDFAYCRMLTHDGDGRAWITPAEKLGCEDLTIERLVLRNFVSTQMLVGRRECFEILRFDPLVPRFQDWDFAIQMFRNYEVVFIDEVLVDQYIQNDSITRDPSRVGPAFRRIYEKNADLYAEYPQAKANMLRTVASSCKNSSPEEARQLYRESLKAHFSLRALAHCLVCDFERVRRFKEQP